MRLLDLFCGIGGAGMGYRRAGFEIVGVDINPMPDYPGPFVRADALEFVARHGRSFDVIHASPPCQPSSLMTKGTRGAPGAVVNADLIPATRLALRAAGVPWVMENVVGSRVRRDLMLCGEMFGLRVLRHRYFQLEGLTVVQPSHPAHRGRVAGWRHRTYVAGDAAYVQVHGKGGGGKATRSAAKLAMGIDWTDDHAAIFQAIPPSFTAYIGKQILEGHLSRVPHPGG
jgi:DNA (cytosine-5)-methyltransferase 1